MNSTHRRILFVASLSTAILGLGGAALAQSVPGTYVSGEGGVSLLPNLDLKSGGTTTHEDFNSGYAYGGAVGYDTGNGTRVEIDSLHQMSGLSRLGGAPVNGHLQSTSVMLNGQVDVLQNAAVTPYVGAGIGYQNVGASIAGAHDADWKPAYQAEAGLRKDISDKVSVFGEYRFSQSEAADLDLGGVDAHQHFSDHGVLAGLTYHMGQ